MKSADEIKKKVLELANHGSPAAHTELLRIIDDLCYRFAQTNQAQMPGVQIALNSKELTTEIKVKISDVISNFTGMDEFNHEIRVNKLYDLFISFPSFPAQKNIEIQTFEEALERYMKDYPPFSAPYPNYQEWLEQEYAGLIKKTK